jgi:hypothetical protein
LKGKVPTAYNSLWRYKTDDYLKNINPPVYWKNNFKPITQHDINGNFIKEWDNMLIASKCLGLNKAGICNALKKDLNLLVDLFGIIKNNYYITKNKII